MYIAVTARMALTEVQGKRNFRTTRAIAVGQ